MIGVSENVVPFENRGLRVTYVKILQTSRDTEFYRSLQKKNIYANNWGPYVNPNHY